MEQITHIPEQLSKAQKYQMLLPQLAALLTGETNLTANLANSAALLKQTFNWWWVGFYWVEKHELVLGPFQGPVACTRIALGKGVCGTAWQKQQTIIVPDVNKFSGHIACSSASQSEIVIPIMHQKQVVGVLDCDSEHLNFFDETDKAYLEQICKAISNTLYE